MDGLRNLMKRTMILAAFWLLAGASSGCQMLGAGTAIVSLRRMVRI